MQQASLYEIQTTSDHAHYVKEEGYGYHCNNQLAQIHLVTDCAMTVQRKIGLGLSEETYTICLGMELFRKGIPYETAKTILVPYGDNALAKDRFHLVVNQSLGIILFPIHDSETLAENKLQTYLNYSRLAACMLIDFNYPIFKKSVKYRLKQ